MGKAIFTILFLMLLVRIAYAETIYTCFVCKVDKTTLQIVDGSKRTWSGGDCVKSSEGLKANEDYILLNDLVEVQKALSATKITVTKDAQGQYVLTYDMTPLPLTEEQKSIQELKAYVLSAFPTLTKAEDLTVQMIKDSTLASSIKVGLYKTIYDGSLK